jgi:hypothetical protein
MSHGGVPAYIASNSDRDRDEPVGGGSPSFT